MIGRIIPDSTKVTASSQYGTGLEPFRAWDNVVDTYEWFSANGSYDGSTGLPVGAASWYQFDLTTSQTITYFHIAPSGVNTCPTQITIFVSETGLFTGEETNCGTVTVSANASLIWTSGLVIPSPAAGRYLRFVIDVASTNNYTGVAEWDLYTDFSAPVYPYPIDATTVTATILTTGYLPHEGVDPKRHSNLYLAGATGSQKFNVDLGTAKVITSLKLDNYQYSGGNVDRGIKDFTIYGTNSATAFSNVTYTDETDLTLIATLSAREHVASTAVDQEVFTFTNTVAYRYYTLKIASNWGGTAIGFCDLDFCINVGVAPAVQVSIFIDQPYGLSQLNILSLVSQEYSFVDFIVAQVSQIYSLRTLSAISELYSLTYPRSCQLEQVYGLRMLIALLQPYGDAPALLQRLLQYYGDSEQLRKAIVQLYEGALQIHNIIDQPYTYPDALQKILEQKYFLSGTELQSISNQLYAIKAVDLITTAIVQPFTVIDGAGIISNHDIKVTCNGRTIRVADVSIEASQDQFCLSCTFNTLSQEDYLVCALLSEIIITIDDVDFTFFVESKGRSRKYDATKYTISGLSKSALLDFPYAEQVTDDLTGLASSITSSLAVGYTVNWDTVDWNIPPDTLLPAEDSPLTLIRKIASAAGAIIQTEPDGTISIEPLYIDAVPSWNTASPTYVFSDAEHFFTTNENFDHRSGHNRYKVSDQQTSSDTLQLTEEVISDTKKYILAYKVPWNSVFNLEHTGGDWVNIEPPIIEENIVENEIVEFVGGAGKTSKPIYAVGSFITAGVVPSKTLGMIWLQKDLGSISFKEDGSLISSIKEESLLRISYLTKYHKCLVTDTRNEPLQLVSERL